MSSLLLKANYQRLSEVSLQVREIFVHLYMFFCFCSSIVGVFIEFRDKVVLEQLLLCFLTFCVSFCYTFLFVLFP